MARQSTGQQPLTHKQSSRSADSAFDSEEDLAENPLGLSRAEKRKRRRKENQKKNEAWLSKKAQRSRERREDKSLHIAAPKPVVDLPISKGGRCGRRELESVIDGQNTGDTYRIREILQTFTPVPQPKCVSIHTTHK